MEYRRLGRSGLKVSRLCLGCMGFGSNASGRQSWAVDADLARPIVRRAVEAGINFFDTADVYSNGTSEELTGKLLRECLPRSQAIIATKVFYPSGLAEGARPGPNDMGLSRKHIMDAVDASLRRLGTDYIDLYIIHRFDRRTPLEETLRALDDLVRAGKVRYLGASSMHAYQFAQLQHVAERNGLTAFVSMQNLYNLAWREEETQMNAFCIETGVGLTPWSPLAGGFLAVDWRTTGKQHSERTRSGASYVTGAFGSPEDYRVFDALKSVADRLGQPTARVALAWLLAQPGVTAPIIGATRAGHLDDALGALDLTLSEADLATLSAAYTFNRALGQLA